MVKKFLNIKFLIDSNGRSWYLIDYEKVRDAVRLRYERDRENEKK